MPTTYFHVVFTLPHELNTLVLYNKKELYSCLLQSSWETIKILGQDPKRLNGLMGALAVLHTWSQNLSIHNHVHLIVPGGALVKNKNDYQWSPSKSNYLFPVKAMSRIFRGIFISALRKLYGKGLLKIPDNLDAETNSGIEKNFTVLLNDLMKKDWVVYSKKPFAGPEKLLDYLGRYVNKIAISNNRILSCDKSSVIFKWRDYSDGNKVKIMKLKSEEFIRRFLNHIVPSGFMRIRFFGFWASACKKKNIALIRRLLSCEPNKKEKENQDQELERKKDIQTLMLELTGVDITLCPKCKQGHLHIIQAIPNKFAKTIFDTS